MTYLLPLSAVSVASRAGDAPPVHTVGCARFHGIDHIEAAYSAWGADCLQLGPADAENSVITATLPKLQCRALEVSGGLRIRATTPPGQAVVQVDCGSVAGRSYNGHLLGQDDMAVGVGRTSFEFVSLEMNCGVDLSMPEDLFCEAFAQRAAASSDLPQPGRLHVARACGSGLGSVRKLSKEILASPECFTVARTIDFAASSLLDAIVDAILVPSRRSGRAALRPALYQRLPLVRRAEEFMRANLGLPIMLHDICRAARASERTVEYAFRDVYGLGAKQFLRLLRLNRLRQELKALPVEAATVEDIANKCGLWHAGHFSTNYRRLFGETPQETRLSRRMGASFAVRT